MATNSTSILLLLIAYQIDTPQTLVFSTRASPRLSRNTLST
ncbi:MAG: hypothetical protein ACPG5R_01785 [Cognaticolwellia aestuarii]